MRTTHDNHESIPPEGVDPPIETSEGDDAHHFIKKDMKPKGMRKSKTSKQNTAFNKEIGRKLTEIYENSDGSMPDMKTFSKQKRNTFLTAFFVLLGACVFLGIVAWAGFFVIQPHGRFSEEDVILSVGGNDTAAFGETVQYRIRYKNSQNVPLARAVLQVRYPKGFVFAESSVAPTSDHKDEWALGDIEPQGSGFIDIKGKLYGDQGSRQSVRAFLNYTPANFNAEFQKVASLTTEIKGAPIELTVTAPNEAAGGADVQIAITVKPTAPLESPLIVRVEPSEGFTKKSSVPDSDEFNAYQWTIPTLTEEKTITLTGAFLNKAAEEKQSIVVKALAQNTLGSQEPPYVLAEATHEFTLAGNEISAQLAINGATGELKVSPGDMLNTSVAVKNISKSALEHAQVRVTFDGPSYNKQSLLAWSSIQDSRDADIVGEQLSDHVRRGVLQWTERHEKALRSINPGDTVTIDFQLPLKSSDDIDLTKFTTADIYARVELSYESGGERHSISGNEMHLLAQSDLGFEVRHETQDEEGKELHLVTWILTNHFHDLENVTLETDLYGDITWEDRLLTIPAGQTNFDGVTRKFKWTIDKMPTSVDVLALRFAVYVNTKNPTQTNLTSKVRIHATDTVTKQEIVKVGDEVLLGN